MALLAAAVSHTPEGEEVLRGARMRMARKPSAVARELLKNFPKGGKRRRKRKRKKESGEGNGGAPEASGNGRKPKRGKSEAGEVDLAGADGDAVATGGDDDEVAPVVDAVGDS